MHEFFARLTDALQLDVYYSIMKKARALAEADEFVGR